MWYLDRWITVGLMTCIAAVALSAPGWTASPNQSFELHGTRYQLAPWDYGAPLGCRPGSHMGITLQSPRGRVWSFAPFGDPERIRAHGCGVGTVVSQSIGVGLEQAAHFAIAAQSCGGSCAGSDVFAYAFDGTHVSQELQQTLGLGGWRFAFPVLTLYINNGYHECPSHWTRLSYRWTPGYSFRYALERSVTYTSRQCYLSRPIHWPPEPGQ